MPNAGHHQLNLDSHELKLRNGLPLGSVDHSEQEEFAAGVSYG